MPQRGYDLQPRVAALATLGGSKMKDFNRNAVAPFSLRKININRRNRFAVEESKTILPG
jgi:hypothetical protein